MKANKIVLKVFAAGAVVLASAGIAFAAPATATTNVNVRSGPSSGYSVVDNLLRGETVEVTGCRGGWCYIEKRGPDGWVSANYLNARRSGSNANPGFSFEFNFGSAPTPQRPQPPRPPRPDHGWDGGWNGGHGGRGDNWNGNDRNGRWDRNDRDRGDWNR